MAASAAWRMKPGLAPVRAVRGLEQDPGLAATQPFLHPFEPGHRKSCLPRHRDSAGQASCKQHLDIGRQGFGHRHLPSCGTAKETLAHGGIKGGSIRCNPYSAPRKLLKDVRNDLAVRADRKADQATLRPGLAGRDAAAFGLAAGPWSAASGQGNSRPSGLDLLFRLGVFVALGLELFGVHPA